MPLVYLALGSNLGDRAHNLRRALQALGEQLTLDAVSPCYETEPAYVLDQPRFYNLTCRAQTTLAPLDLLHHLKELETRLGREPTVRFGPRVIDLDILFYDDLVLDTPELTLPHPRLQERAFVLVPLADIAPDLVHPTLKLTIAELRDRLGDTLRGSSVQRVVKFHHPHHPLHPLTMKPLTIKSATFDWGRQTYLMGIVNVTPDSFSGDGLIKGEGNWVAAAVAQGKAQVEQGAHILDVGGESTRPGSQSTSAEEELRRVLPVIRALADVVNVPISIDTYKAEVARQAVAAGATIVNDVWGLRMDPDMGRVVAETGAALIVMHNRSKPKDAVQEAQLGGRYVGVEYKDLLGDIIRELQVSVDIALAAGVSPEKIIVDPGIGFGKTVEQNLELLDRLSELKALGYPILAGPSRKSFVGYTLNLPPDQRLEGTAAAVALAIDRGADIVRVHDVAAMTRVARFTDAVVRR
ncbi:MAG: dihydropteroate synthase [Anaerolineales bacterium]|nr:dihydropteroate synthase [Anaerolineales bacterium]